MVQTLPVDDFRPIAHEGRIVWGSSAVVTLLAAGLVAAGLLAPFSVPAAAAALIVALCAAGGSWWLTGRHWRSWGYAERDLDLLVRRGVLIRRLVVVPYGRMQFVEVRQGPLERLLGCAGVRLHTAAAATDAHIPWLKLDEADRLRAHLTQLGETHAAGL